MIILRLCEEIKNGTSYHLEKGKQNQFLFIDIENRILSQRRQTVQSVLVLSKSYMLGELETQPITPFTFKF